MKFPDTDIEAPEAIEALPEFMGEYEDWFENTWFEAGSNGKCHSIKYLRADTVTPNEFIIEMMRTAYRNGWEDGVKDEEEGWLGGDWDMNYENSMFKEIIDKNFWNKQRNNHAPSDSD